MQFLCVSHTIRHCLSYPHLSVLETSPYSPHKSADVDIIKPFRAAALLNRKLKLTNRGHNPEFRKMNQVTGRIRVY